jgi:hypothetical protein
MEDSFTNYRESVSTSAEPNNQSGGRAETISPSAEPNNQSGGGAETISPVV